MHIIITASPNTDGLTAACAKAAADGLNKSKTRWEHYDLCAGKINPCLVCGNGWGVCLETAKCAVDDMLNEIQLRTRGADGLILITPVYWGQPSERMKYFLDRFRRCEAFSKVGSAAKGKQIDLIAAAGGSGNGTATCLSEMETWCRHVGAVPKDRIGITRFNREPMLEVISNMATRLADGDYFKGF